MTLRADIPVTALAFPQPAPRPQRLAEGFLAPVADGATAVFFDTGHAPADGRRDGRHDGRRIAIEADGAALAGRRVSTLLPLRGGGTRHVLLLGRSAAWLRDRRLVVACAGTPAAVIDPAWLQSPLVDVAALFDGLSDDGRQRLLRLILTTGASLLGHGARPDFARAARGLLALLGVPTLAPLGWCRIGAAARLVSYRLPAGFDPDRLGPLAALAGDALGRLAGDPLAVEPRAGGALLHLCLEAAPSGASLVATGPAPLALSLPPAGMAAMPVEAWLRRRPAATRAWAEARLTQAAASDPVAAAVLRELVHRDAPAPELAIGHLSGTPAGVLHALHLRDPHGLVAAVRLTRGADSALLPVTGGDPAPGYLALPRASLIDDRLRLALVCHSGRSLPVAAGRLAAFDGRAPAALPADAVAAARIEREPTGRVLRVESFGAVGSAPALAVVCPVASCLDLIRTRAALAFAEPGGEAVEFVYHAPEGPAAAAARTLLAETAAVFGLRHRLVVVTPDLDAAGRIAAAVAAAEAPRLLLLGAEVLPAAPGWVAPWRRLSRRHPMLAATVTGYDGGDTAEATDALGLFRDAVGDALAAAGPGTPAMLAAMLAASLRRRRMSEARLGLVFTRFGDGALTSFEKSVDAAAVTLILKRSFSIGCEEGRP